MTTDPLPYSFSKTHGILVTGGNDAPPILVVRQGAALTALAEARRMLGVPVSIETVTASSFDARLAEIHSWGEDDAADVIADAGQEIDLDQLITELPAVEDLLETRDDAPIIRMINALLTQAVRQAASDIHIEPYERYSTVRFRRDGVLLDVARPQHGLHAAMASRIKVMAHLDIAEKRLPQDGRISLRLAGRQIDVRVSTLPTTYGERIVLRLLDKGSGLRSLDSLGMAEETFRPFAGLLDEPHGIALVTGPTGSGKSTTLYSALQTMDTRARNIVTVEDPVEYDLPGVAQIQVNPRIELSFARALRAILRQDPDVIMIGEIRDLETAQIAVQASLTGHLVLATLHTNDATSAVTRLVDMGIEPFLLASSLRGVLAQRLVRRLCRTCRQPIDDDPHLPSMLGMALPSRTWDSVGCPECALTGYAGRTGIYELILIDDTLQRLIHDSAGENALRAYARSRGVQRLRDDGFRLLAEGVTSVRELLRVTRD